MTQMGGHLITRRRQAGPARCSRWPRPPPWPRTPAAVAAAVTHDVVLGGVSVELVQVGSLCHDDVIDEAETRRGVDSVNARWGNLKAILAGDFLLAKASEIAAVARHRGGRRCSPPRSGGSATARCNELRHAYDPARTDRVVPPRHRGQDGRAVRHRLPGRRDRRRPAPRRTSTASPTSGCRYGMAFQIVDDVLDVIATDEQLGKPAGHDIAEGIYNLPVLHALEELGGDLGDAARRPDRRRRPRHRSPPRPHVDGRRPQHRPGPPLHRRGRRRARLPSTARPSAVALAGAATHLLVGVEAVLAA